MNCIGVRIYGVYLRLCLSWVATNHLSRLSSGRRRTEAPKRRRREAGATPARSALLPRSNTAIKTRVKTLEAC